MSGDQIVALIGLVLALILVTRGGTLRRLGRRRQLQYAAVWAVILGAGALIAAWLSLSVN